MFASRIGIGGVTIKYGYGYGFTVSRHVAFNLEVDQKQLSGRTMLYVPRRDEQERFEFCVVVSLAYQIEGSGNSERHSSWRRAWLGRAILLVKSLRTIIRTLRVASHKGVRHSTPRKGVRGERGASTLATGKCELHIVLVAFLQKVMFKERMTTVEYEFLNALWRVTGVALDWDELLLDVDADMNARSRYF
ncbi:hypothetical protein B0H14DRAFT_3699384 [Mycena olivaceomarginata]|nr:hypothetical protein B0H14DRAFT_3699384 [Mycena olivaceomarginata]